MTKLDIVIDELDGALWAAAIDSKRRLFALECDAVDEEVRWGSIFLGKIETIDKKLDACWVNIGVKDHMGLLPRKEWPDPNTTPQAGTFLTVQAKTGISNKKSIMETEQSDEQKLLLKIKLEPKMARLSTDVTLPGRYVIFAPGETENRLSRRINDRKVRRNMTHMLKDLTEVLQGCILRSSAKNVQTDMLVREGKILHKKWNDLHDASTNASGPKLLAHGPNAIERILSDMSGCQIENIYVSLLDHFDCAEEWCETFAPDFMTKIAPVELNNATDDFALFDHYDLIPQIENVLSPYSMLPGGGNIILQQTAALMAIDVNRGEDRTSSNLELNIEAAHEAGRQLRLRNIGGIILIDFLKMKTKADEGRVIAAMEEAIANDACTVQIHGMTELGLMEVTRQRRLPPLNERISFTI